MKAKDSMEFYKNAFGFTISRIVNDDNNSPIFVEMRFGEVVIMFNPEGAYGNNNKAPITQQIEMPLNLYIYCSDVDAIYNQAIANGAKSKLVPNDAFWGDRFCTLIDINGYEWSFATHIQKI